MYFVSALSVVGLASATILICLSLCWFIRFLIYTVFSLMVLSILSFYWSCGTLCLQWCLLFFYFFWYYYIFKLLLSSREGLLGGGCLIFLTSPFFLK